jgi:hypothetical protein
MLCCAWDISYDGNSPAGCVPTDIQVYVHPIPPVLDVTRKMVIRYNALYKEAVKGIKGERCCCCCCCFAVLH